MDANRSTLFDLTPKGLRRARDEGRNLLVLGHPGRGVHGSVNVACDESDLRLILVRAPLAAHVDRDWEEAIRRHAQTHDVVLFAEIDTVPQEATEIIRAVDEDSAATFAFTVQQDPLGEVVDLGALLTTLPGEPVVVDARVPAGEGLA